MYWEVAIASFGITAAVLLIGGSILLRYQRDRQHFVMMQAALERGITSLPGMAPGWLVSLRVGVLALGLGMGLIGTGVTFHVTAEDIDPVPVGVMGRGMGGGMGGPQGGGGGQGGIQGGGGGMQPGYQGGVQGSMQPGGGGGGGGGQRGPGMQPGGGVGMGMQPGMQSGGPPDRQGPGPGQNPPPPQQNGQPRNGPQGPQPPPPQGSQGPQMDRWSRIQTQRTAGLLAMCAGVTFVLLGLVRMGFAMAEKRYASDGPRESAAEKG